MSGHFLQNKIFIDTTEIFMETLDTQQGSLNRFIISTEYYSLEEADKRQQEAIMQQRSKINKRRLKHGDVIIAVYDKKNRERIMIYYDIHKMEYKILI